MDRRLLAHLIRFACSRARLRDGSRMEMSSAMMPMTTSSSTSVNPATERLERDEDMTTSFTTTNESDAPAATQEQPARACEQQREGCRLRHAGDGDHPGT